MRESSERLAVVSQAPPSSIIATGATKNNERRVDYVIPEYPKSTVNAAARMYALFEAGPEELRDVSLIVHNWRVAHYFPLNGIYMLLKSYARKVGPSAITAQRLKRLQSITYKLRHKPQLDLTDMQDIGGCRAIMRNVSEVENLRAMLVHRARHTLKNEDDYIARPRSTGYRGIHRIYFYRGKPQYDGMQIEVQIRTRLQHIWATAVEMASIFRNEALKNNRGSPEWLRFFALVSACFADEERCPTVPRVSKDMAIVRDEIRELVRRNDILNMFMSYHQLTPHMINSKRAKYFMVRLDPEERRLTVTGFANVQSQSATQSLFGEEHPSFDSPAPAPDVVMVKVESIAALPKAYPNYYMDASEFVERVRSIVG